MIVPERIASTHRRTVVYTNAGSHKTAAAIYASAIPDNEILSFHMAGRSGKARIGIFLLGYFVEQQPDSRHSHTHLHAEDSFPSVGLYLFDGNSQTIPLQDTLLVS